MFRQMPIAAIFLHSFYFVLSSVFWKNIVLWPHHWKPLGENQGQIQNEDLFLEFTMFWDKKLTQTEVVYLSEMITYYKGNT